MKLLLLESASDITKNEGFQEVGSIAGDVNSALITWSYYMC